MAIHLDLIPFSKEDKKRVKFKVGNHVKIFSSDIFYEGLRGQNAIVSEVGYHPVSMMKTVRVVAPNHMVPNVEPDYEWEIVPDLLDLIANEAE